MPTKIEKASVSGRDTAGHEWDGIKELDTPLPKWWLYVFYATIAWSLAYFVLYPAIPYGTGYLHGLLVNLQHKAVNADVSCGRCVPASTRTLTVRPHGSCLMTIEGPGAGWLVLG